MEQMVEWFSLEALNKGAARFDFVKLENINGHYIREADDARLAAMVTDYLERSGFRISHAANAAEGLNQVQTGPRVDLVILDLMLPARDGLEVCRSIRALPAPVKLLNSAALQKVSR